MKKLLLLLTGIASVQIAFSQQFQGILTYEAVNSLGTNKTVTTVALTSTKGRIDCNVYGLKNGQVDSSNVTPQNPLIYDFSAGTLTKLVYKVNMASVGPPTDVMMQKAMHFDPGTVTITFVGNETVNGYACKHFTITDTKFKSKKEVWITSSLGTSNLCIQANFLYYTPGNPILQKLIAAGGSGVVVKSSAGYTTSTLVKVFTGPIRSSIFQIPSGYSTMQGPQ